MEDRLHIDPVALFDEVVRYLAVIDAFRAADCEPSWRVETGPLTADTEPKRPRAHIERSAH